MENFIRRFPDGSEMIFNNLDDQSLVRSKEISRETSRFMENERFHWVRIIMKYNDNWRFITKKKSIKNLKELAIESEKSYWIQILERYKKKFQAHEESWKEVTTNIPINILKQLVTSVKQYSKLYNQFREEIAPFQITAESGNLELCEYVISKTINKNPTFSYGNTVPHESAKNGHLNVCRLIIENVANKNPANNFGHSPLHWAAMLGHLDLCRLIIENVKNINPVDKYGRTPNDFASNPETSKLFEKLDTNND